jgi:predicted metal-dependent HD superfamily phosphohydrolase
VSLARQWPLPDGDSVRDELLAAYGSPARGYHDRRHLSEVLARLAELAGAGVAFPRVPVLLAAWFHDGVYAGRPDDEERSAVWAENALPGLVAPTTVSEVARLVRLTARHRPAPEDLAGAALCDADLAILASGRERYDEYVAGVRQDFAHVDDESFAGGRAAVLRDLLAGESLFHTSHGREAWEAAARGNLERELASLGGS